MVVFPGPETEAFVGLFDELWASAKVVGPLPSDSDTGIVVVSIGSIIEYTALLVYRELANDIRREG